MLRLLDLANPYYIVMWCNTMLKSPTHTRQTNDKPNKFQTIQSKHRSLNFAWLARFYNKLCWLCIKLVKLGVEIFRCECILRNMHVPILARWCQNLEYFAYNSGKHSSVANRGWHHIFHSSAIVVVIVGLCSPSKFCGPIFCSPTKNRKPKCIMRIQRK